MCVHMYIYIYIHMFYICMYNTYIYIYICNYIAYISYMLYVYITCCMHTHVCTCTLCAYILEIALTRLFIWCHVLLRTTRVVSVVHKQINAPLKADHPERPTITLGWSLVYPRGILESKVYFLYFMISQSGWHRNRGVFISSHVLGECQRLSVANVALVPFFTWLFYNPFIELCFQHPNVSFVGLSTYIP